VVLANVMHDAYCTFKVPALRQQVQRKESIALIYQNADLVLDALGSTEQATLMSAEVNCKCHQIVI
jgi:hypothetical protein